MIAVRYLTTTGLAIVDPHQRLAPELRNSLPHHRRAYILNAASTRTTRTTKRAPKVGQIAARTLLICAGAKPFVDKLSARSIPDRLPTKGCPVILTSVQISSRKLQDFPEDKGCVSCERSRLALHNQPGKESAWPATVLIAAAGDEEGVPGVRRENRTGIPGRENRIISGCPWVVSTGPTQRVSD